MKTKFLQYPIIVLNGEQELPESGSYYVIADNGIFFHKEDGILSIDFKVESITDLDHYDQSEVKLKFPKIPAQRINEIKLFFATVVEKYKAESCVNLFYSAKEKNWAFKISEQDVSHGGVAYDKSAKTIELPLGYVPVGSIHSHCDFEAFHSGVDVSDEKNWDGLHVTFGHNDREQFTITACVVNNNGVRIKIDPLDVMDGIRLATNVSGRYELETNVYDQETIDNINSWVDNLVERM